jgi:Asp-tRNA(Asn)/Glu-tRNA(Gln) amidotransferase A subunit family amidase
MQGSTEATVTKSTNPFSTLTDLAGALARRDLSALELAEFYLARIEHANPKLNAFVTVEAELARNLAQASVPPVCRSGRWMGSRSR